MALAWGLVISTADTAQAVVSLRVETPQLPLERGDRGPAVQDLQLLLATAGFNPGPVDGIFGPMTQTAVSGFQSAHSLTSTGVVDQPTWDALTAVPPVLLWKQGDRGDGVRTLQQLLASAGLSPGTIDGIYGSKTALAVALFQARISLPETGSVDQATWNALSADPPEILLKRGDRGDQARALQLLLATAGYNPGPIDGIFGGLTEAAVTAFQSAHGLPATGRVDQATWDALSNIPIPPEILFEKGDTGPQVEAIQDQLATVGFDPGPIDGIFGTKTATAIERFHSVHGLAGEGGVTRQTLDKLAELVPQALTAYSYGYVPGDGPEQWRALVTDVFALWGLDVEACGTGDNANNCIGSQIDNALTIMACESSGIPMAVNYLSGTTGLFQHRPSYWADRVARTREKFPDFPATATPYNPEHNIMVAALLVWESREALIGNNDLAGPWDDGPQPWGHWDSSSRYCANPPLVKDS